MAVKLNAFLDENTTDINCSSILIDYINLNYSGFSYIDIRKENFKLNEMFLVGKINDVNVYLNPDFLIEIDTIYDNDGNELFKLDSNLL